VPSNLLEVLLSRGDSSHIASEEDHGEILESLQRSSILDPSSDGDLSCVYSVPEPSPNGHTCTFSFT
jgi:hypothetical protein